MSQQTTREPWTINQLHNALQDDLALCNTNFERGVVRGMCGKEIREKAHALAKARRLTPAEMGIAERFGYRQGGAA